jgi:hypothetical protein
MDALKKSLAEKKAPEERIEQAERVPVEMKSPRKATEAPARRRTTKKTATG